MQFFPIYLFFYNIYLFSSNFSVAFSEYINLFIHLEEEKMREFSIENNTKRIVR